MSKTAKCAASQSRCVIPLQMTRCMALNPERREVGPLVFHSDSTPVSEHRPAQAGQLLYLFARGLGPTHPDADLTQPFPATPPSVVSAPVTVTAGGKAALNVIAAGLPAAVDGYRVDFKMPADAGTGAIPAFLPVGWLGARR